MTLFENAISLLRQWSLMRTVSVSSSLPLFRDFLFLYKFYLPTFFFNFFKIFFFFFLRSCLLLYFFFTYFFHLGSCRQVTSQRGFLLWDQLFLLILCVADYAKQISFFIDILCDQKLTVIRASTYAFIWYRRKMSHHLFSLSNYRL